MRRGRQRRPIAPVALVWPLRCSGCDQVGVALAPVLIQVHRHRAGVTPREGSGSVGPVNERRLLLVNGPNLNLLGTREPELYGTDTLDDVTELVMYTADEFGYAVSALQSNHEGVLIDEIHQARQEYSAIVINPGGLSHTSVVLRDALVAVQLPVAEVHISDISTREDFRRHSYISDIADVVVAGEGTAGYAKAVRELIAIVQSS